MRLLLDTHLLLRAALQPDDLPRSAARLMADPGNDLLFSVVSVWEAVIKNGRGRDDFEVDPRVWRSRMLHNGYEELTVEAEHALAVADLPPIHRDPFDRLLVAQAAVEDLIFVTADALVARYPGAILKV